MSDLYSETQDNAELPLASSRPEELPPIEPPSAKFIVQLFVVPGLIVAIIVGAWFLFGKLASSEQDWQSLVQDIRSGNEHRRGRGAMGLAQLLNAEQLRNDDGPRLATNRQVAQELSSFTAGLLKSDSHDEASLNQQQFLVLALGRLDVPDVVLPVLRDAMQQQHSLEVRNAALLAVAMIAERAAARGAGLSGDEIVDDVVTLSRDNDARLRLLAAATLGSFPAKVTKQPLLVLLADEDADTRANAAIAFTRQKSLDGLPILREILVTGAALRTAPEKTTSSIKATSNALKAVGELSSQLDIATRSEIIRDVEAISNGYPEARVRLDAAQALTKLRRDSK